MVGRREIAEAIRAYVRLGHFRPYDPTTYVPIEEFILRYLGQPK